MELINEILILASYYGNDAQAADEYFSSQGGTPKGWGYFWVILIGGYVVMCMISGEMEKKKKDKDDLLAFEKGVHETIERKRREGLEETKRVFGSDSFEYKQHLRDEEEADRLWEEREKKNKRF